MLNKKSEGQYQRERQQNSKNENASGMRSTNKNGQSRKRSVSEESKEQRNGEAGREKIGRMRSDVVHTAAENTGTTRSRYTL